jgi:FdrA protein
MKSVELFNAPLNVINVGLEKFSEELAELDVPVTHVEWRPPAGGNKRLAELLSKLGV